MEIMDRGLPWYKHLKVREELKPVNHLVFQVINSNTSTQSLNQRLQPRTLEIDFDETTDIKHKIYFLFFG